MAVLYDTIGKSYAKMRRADSRIAAAILNVLGKSQSVVNVGAGTGSYEPAGRTVVAIEPSWTMASQRPAHAAPVVLGRSEHLPLPDSSFDAVLATLTVHHWADQQRGLGECMRVARERFVILSWDPGAAGFWMMTDYFPEILARDRRLFPSLELIQRTVGQVEILPVEIPSDCTDGFLGAYWQRPEMYLNEDVRKGMSSFSQIAGTAVGLARLQRDLESGEWDARYSHLRRMSSLDIGYRLFVAKK